MSEEEKKAVIFLKHFLEDDDDVFKISNKDLRIILNLIEKQQKELNSLKEIEKSHQEENGKLRVELEQYKLLEANIDKANKIIAENKFDEGLYGLLMQEKEKNKELEATNKAFHHFIMFTGGKDIKDISATEYMRIRQEGYIDGRCYEQQKAEEIITNNYISKDKIKEKYLEMEQEYAKKVYDNNYNRTEVKKEEMYKRQVYENLLEGYKWN